MNHNAELHSLRKFGNLLGTHTEIVENLFKNFTHKEVLEFACVCKLWHSVALRKIKQFGLYYTTIYPQSTSKDSIAAVQQFATQYEQYIECLPFKPFVCLAFISSNCCWPFKIPVAESNAIKEELSVHDALVKGIGIKNSKCKLATMTALGIVGTVQSKAKLSHSLSQDEQSDYTSSRDSFSNSSKNKVHTTDTLSFNKADYSVEVENMDSSFYAIGSSFLIIPNLPGVKINVLCISNETLNKKIYKRCGGNVSLTSAQFNSICELQPNDDLKALLVFDCGLSDMSAFCHAAVARQNQKLSIGGACIESLQIPNDKSNSSGSSGDSPNAVVITFVGHRIKTASIIVPKSVKTQAAFEVYVKKLQDCNLPLGHSVAFMFSCSGRGCYWYRKEKPLRSSVESRIFRKVFPNTPIFGVFGDGEIGLNHLPNYEEPHAEPQRKKPRLRVFHIFSTVIVIVAFV